MWRIDQTTTPAAILHLAHACTGRTPAPLKHCKTTGSWATQVQGLKEMSLATGMSLTGVLGFFPISWGGVYSRLGLCNHTQQCCQCHHMSLQWLQHKVCPYRTAATQISHYSHSNTKRVHTELQQHKSVVSHSNTKQVHTELQQHRSVISHSNTKWVHTELQQHRSVITVTPTQSESIQNCSNTNQSLVTPTQSESIQNFSNTNQSLQSLQHKASPYGTVTQISHVITVTANTRHVHTELQQHKSHVTITQHGSYKGHKHFLELVYGKHSLKKCIMTLTPTAIFKNPALI